MLSVYDVDGRLVVRKVNCHSLAKLGNVDQYARSAIAVGDIVCVHGLNLVFDIGLGNEDCRRSPVAIRGGSPKTDHVITCEPHQKSCLIRLTGIELTIGH